MQPATVTIGTSTPLNEAIHRLAEDARDALPLVDDDGRYRGVLLATEIEEAVRGNTLDATAGELARATATLTPGQSLHEALQLLARADGGGLPVVRGPGGDLVGWLSHRDVLLAYARRLEHSVGQAQGVAGKGLSSRDLMLRDTPLHGYRVVDLTLDGHAPLIDRRISEVSWPRSTLVIALRRGDTAEVPHAHTVMRRGDRLAVLVPGQLVDDLIALACADCG
jgi:CIC family chloride channel protein